MSTSWYPDNLVTSSFRVLSLPSSVFRPPSSVSCLLYSVFPLVPLPLCPFRPSCLRALVARIPFQSTPLFGRTSTTNYDIRDYELKLTALGPDFDVTTPVTTG